MVYIDKAGMIARFGADELIQLTDMERTGAIDDGVLDLAIADAVSEVKGYVEARYPLEALAGIPSVLVGICADVTRFRLYRDSVPEHVKTRYDAAVRMLKSIASGAMVLGVGAASAATGLGAPGYRPLGNSPMDDALGRYLS